jgi:Sigma-54 interaction domain
MPSDLHADWDVAVHTQHNLLLEGSPSHTAEWLAALKPHLREPMCEFRAADGACLPQPREGTLILLEVARLDEAQQTALLRWFDTFDGSVPVRIVSTSSEPLFSLVGSGAFPAQLYYRLNVVLIELPRSGESTR